MNKPAMIPVFSNSLGDEELEAVRKVFASKWLGKGKECDSLEEELGRHFQSPHVLLTNTCTAAIYISLQALGIGKGDEVIIPTANFVGVANAVVDCGAKPVFADVDPEYFNLLPQEVDRLKTPKTKAIFLLHYGGHPVRFHEIKQIAGDKIFICEDSANAISSKYKGKFCGTLGDAGVFSFDAMKTLVMGDGGALILRDNETYRKAKACRYFGFAETTTSGTDAMKQGQSRWWEFELARTSGRHISNDILASIGRVQLKKLPEFIKRRKEIWSYYQKSLSNISGVLTPPESLPSTESSYYLYWIRVAKKRDELANYLKGKGIYTTFRYYPLHRVKFYGHTGKLPNAELMNETALNLPIHQNLTDSDINRVTDEIKAFFR